MPETLVYNGNLGLAEEHLARYYESLAERRAVQAVRNGGAADIQYAEACRRVFPQVAGN